MFNAKFFLTSAVLCAISAISWGTVTETDTSYVVSGKSYKIDFDKATGAITKIEDDGDELTLRSMDKSLWTATFFDGKTVSSANSKLTANIDSDTLKLKFISPEIDVSIDIKGNDQSVDFFATTTPKAGDLQTFSAPAPTVFAPKKLKGLLLHNSIPRNSGISLTSNFFSDRTKCESANAIWAKGECAQSKAYQTILGAPIKMHPKYRDFFQLKEGKDAQEWLGADLAKKLSSLKAQSTRTFADGNADIVIADSPNGTFFGASKLGGKGAIFRIGGWLGNAQEHNPAEYISVAIKHAKKISADSKRNKVLLLNFPTSGVSSRIKISDWAHILKRSGCEIVPVENIDSLQKGLSDASTLAIINPYEELCPTPLNMPLQIFANEIKNFVVNGGYWFETGGYSFFYELTPKKYLSIKGDVPASAGDFFHFQLGSKYLAIYAIQPIKWEAWEAAKDKTKMFIPSSFDVYACDEGGVLSRRFNAFVEKNQTFKMPQVRFLFGANKLESADKFCADNAVTKTFDSKMPKALADKFKQCVLYKASDSSVLELQKLTDNLPQPCIVHTASYLKGGFDKEYPDHFPPRQSFATPEQLKAYIAHVKARGDFYMPYINNTWWCDNPKGPTFEKNGEIAFSLDKDGKPYHEVYGKNDGWTITMWHPAVRQANDNLLKEALEDYPSDFVFQDQSGARSSRYDFNKESPTPNAYIEGMISTVRQDAQKAYLSTEDGWYGICDWEIQFCGMSFGFIQKISWANLLWNDIPQDAFVLDNLIGALFHDKVSLTHHNLGTSVNNPRDMAMTLAYGFSMINWATSSMMDNWHYYPDWIKWVDSIQKAVASKYIGKKMELFKHNWTDINGTNGDSVIKAKYGDVSITANTGEKNVKVKKVSISKDGFYATAPDMIAGAGIVKIADKKIPPSSYIIEKIGDKTFVSLYAQPDSDAYFQLFSDIKALKMPDGTLIEAESKDKVGVVKMPISKYGEKVFMRFECVE